MAGADRDWMQRVAAFQFLENLTDHYGEVLPFRDLQAGFEFEGKRLGLVSMRGIWKPAAMDLPISIRTGLDDPYGDEAGEDGLLHYRYFQDDPQHPDNAGLRTCFQEGRPLIYLRAVAAGRYQALWPMVIVHDDPGMLTFTAACEAVESLRPGVPPDAADDARRRYVTRLAVARLHQAKFRHTVLTAYRQSCAICSLRHTELLDAAHILSDRHEHGDPVVTNGLALCKIHHASFDRNILGVRPDRVVEIRDDILEEHDGPMLRHGLQELHGASLRVLPRRSKDQPDPVRLEERYEQFRAAS